MTSVLRTEVEEGATYRFRFWRPELLNIISRVGRRDGPFHVRRSGEGELNTQQTHTSGRWHGVADKETYDTRIDAVHFALNHDDGQSTRQYDRAQVILVGVSRSGKTPTSLYLAMQFGIQAANYPMTSDDLESPQLPKVLRNYRANLFGLTIDPEQLTQIRQARRPNSRYASLSQCRSEVEDCEQLFRRFAIPYVDTTATSIEEISSKVIHTMGIERRLF